MTADIIKRLRKAREGTIEVDGHKYTYRRPTDAEATQFADSNVNDIVRKFVCGWDMTEADLLPSGGSDVVPFSADLWREYVDDHPALWEPIFTAILDAYSKHQKDIESAGKA